MNEELSDKEISESVKDFKTGATREQRRKRLKFYVKQYKDHMNKLNSIKSVGDDDPEKIEGLNKFVKKHILHANILKDYIKSFVPKTWNKEGILFENKTVYYNGREL